MNKRILQLFDVSLRDGIQSIQSPVSFKNKRSILHNIISRNVKDIEVGSFVSPKILPQFNDSLKLYNYAKSIGIKNNNYYILFPNSNHVKRGVEAGVENLSLITSVSESFQKKNINKTLEETKSDLMNSFDIINTNRGKINNVKLYVSCINECPIDGIISPSVIVNELSYYHHNFENITNLCLSDTCGTLKPDVFEIIIGKSTVFEGISPEKISLHLHCNNNDFERVNKIIQIAQEYDIYKIDVSLLDSGGCSVTMDVDKINRNLSYDDISLLN
jgi:hydroxymethylglutaryl-CoA lyase